MSNKTKNRTSKVNNTVEKEVIEKIEVKNENNSIKKLNTVNEKIYNTDNVYIQNFQKNELSLIDKIEILLSFILSHITDLVQTIKTFTNNLITFKLLNTNNESELKKELLKITSLKVESYELEKMKKTRNDYLQKTFKNTITFNEVTNLFEINVNEYLNEYSTIIDKYKKLFINYNDKNLFKDYVCKTKNSETSKKFNDIMKVEKYSYNIVRNIKLFNELRKMFIESTENEVEKLQLKKNSIFVLTNEMFEIEKLDSSTKKHRSLVENLLKNEIDNLTTEQIENLYNTEIFESIELQINEITKFSNVSNLLKRLS